MRPLLIVIVFTLIKLSYSQCSLGSLPTNHCTISSGDIEYFAPLSSAHAGSNTLSIQSAQSPVHNHILVIQMQGVEINDTNTNSYGSGDGSGIGYFFNPLVDTIGKYEFNTISSTLVVPGGFNITLENNLENNFEIGSQYRYQVISFPFCKNLTINTNLDIPPWDGNTGGVLPILANRIQLDGNINFNLDGFGFRGGLAVGDNGDETSLDFRNDCNPVSGADPDGEKGEGIAGQPSFVQTETSTYPPSSGGSCGKGAPGNAGGGGNRGPKKSGGGAGGGSNGGRGEDGVYIPTKPVDGEPDPLLYGLGAPSLYPGANPQYDRIYMGGGGGAGRQSDNADGGNGGGIIIMHANIIESINTNSILTLSSIGLSQTVEDYNGGGGAGGSIIFLTTILDPAVQVDIYATGAAGVISTDKKHGSSGAGGGGVIYNTEFASVSTDITGGGTNNGIQFTVLNTDLSNFPSNKFVGCYGDPTSPTSTPTPSVSPTNTQTGSITPSLSESNTPTRSISLSITPTKTPTSSHTLSPSSTLSPSDSATRSATVTTSTTASPSKSTSATNSATKSTSTTNSATKSVSHSPTSSLSFLTSPSVTSSITKSISESLTPVPSTTSSITISSSMSISKFSTFSPTESSTISISVSNTNSIVSSPTPTSSNRLAYMLPPEPENIPISVSPTPQIFQIPVSPMTTITASTISQFQVNVFSDGTIIGSVDADASDEIFSIVAQLGEDSTNPNVVSPVLNVIAIDEFGNEIPFSGDAEICIKTEESKLNKNSCLGYLDESVKPPKWKCEDRCISSKDGQICGSTSHFTNFAVLLEGGSSSDNPCGSSYNGYIFDKSWKDFVLLSSFSVGTICLACCCIILVLICPPVERFVYGKEGYRISSIRKASCPLSGEIVVLAEST